MGAMACLLCTAGGARAQAVADPTAETLIEAARDRYRPPGLRAECAPAAAGEIVVCAQGEDEQRLSSPTDDAIARGEAVYDGMPRAPEPLDWPPCKPTIFNNFCARVYRPLPRPVLIDLAALPEALTAEEAAAVFRAEETPE